MLSRFRLSDNNVTFVLWQTHSGSLTASIYVTAALLAPKAFGFKRTGVPHEIIIRVAVPPPFVLTLPVQSLMHLSTPGDDVKSGAFRVDSRIHP